jgi:phage terminase large subunit
MEPISQDDFNELSDYYLEHPEEFVRDVLGATPWEKQVEIIQAIFKYSIVAVKTANSIGKTYIAARIALTYLMLHRDSIVVTTAPTFRQVRDALWREIRSAVKQAELHGFKLTNEEVSQTGLNIDTKWYAIGVSTSTPDNMRGYHANHLLVVVDEAGGVEDQIFNGVRSITTNVNNKILLIGNPTRPDGEFFRAFDKTSRAKQFTISAFDTPNFIANDIRTVDDLVARFTPPPDLSDDQRRDHYETTKHSLRLPYEELTHPGDIYLKYLDWGADSPAWQSLVMGEFPSQGEQALIPADLVRMAMEMHGIDEATGKTMAELSGWKIPDGPPEYGMDVARFGPDLNVLTPRRGGWVDTQIVWNKKGDEKLDVDESADRILRVINPLDYNTVLNIDDTGLGGGTTATLNRQRRAAMQGSEPAHQYRLVPYNMASKLFMRQPDKFHDITSELYWNLRTWFYKKQIALHPDTQLYNELIARRWTITPQGKIKVESKEEYKKRTGGKSPDKSDSLALAFSSGDRAAYTRSPITDSQTAQPVVHPITSGIGSYSSGLGRQF